MLWKREGRRPLGRWEDDIVMGLEEIEWEDTDWIHVTWDRARGQVIRNIIMNLWVSSIIRNFLISQITVTFSGSTSTLSYVVRCCSMHHCIIYQIIEKRCMAHSFSSFLAHRCWTVASQ
jgi:hypothetical protein